MGDENGGPPLSRRVPGAARSGPTPVARVALPESLLLRMQAAVEAERRQVPVPDQEQPATREPAPPQDRAAHAEP